MHSVEHILNQTMVRLYGCGRCYLILNIKIVNSASGLNFLDRIRKIICCREAGTAIANVRRKMAA
jgi:uncharacterized phosphosugar-binding protein